MCSKKNTEMYAVAKEILTEYEGISTADILQIRQPFAGSARVKFDELAQAYGDKLYQTQFDASQDRDPTPGAEPTAGGQQEQAP